MAGWQPWKIFWSSARLVVKVSKRAWAVAGSLQQATLLYLPRSMARISPVVVEAVALMKASSLGVSGTGNGVW